MKNVKFKLTVWIIILIAGIIFYWQNRSPEVSLIIFGSETIALPVSLWLIIGAIAGLIASIVLQFLLGVYSGKRRRSREWDDEEEQDGEFEFPEARETTNERFSGSKRFDDEPEANSIPNSRQEEALPEEEDWESPPRREDWNDPDDEWNIEEPPRREMNSPPPNNDNFYEVQNRPEKTSQQGSVYSYRYRQASSQSNNFETIEQNEEENDNNNDDESKQSPKVYEANYRVIRPPLWNLPDAEENWDEEEDDPNQR